MPDKLALIFPGQGVVGIENTHVVTEDGLEQFGKFPDDIVIIKAIYGAKPVYPFARCAGLPVGPVGPVCRLSRLSRLVGWAG